MRSFLAFAAVLVFIGPALSQKKQDEPVSIDPAVWANSPQTYEGKLVTFKGWLDSYLPDQQRKKYFYHLRAKWKREPDPSNEIDKGDAGVVEIKAYFTKNIKELRDRDRLVTIEVKGRVVSNGERRDDDPRRRDLVIDDAELIKIED